MTGNGLVRAPLLILVFVLTAFSGRAGRSVRFSYDKLAKWGNTGNWKSVISAKSGCQMIHTLNQQDDKVAVYLGKKKIGIYGLVDNLTISPDGRRTAFRAENNRGWTMVNTGRSGNTYEMVWEPTFSPDSRKIAYAARSKGFWHVVVGTSRGPRFSSVNSPIFSYDGKTVAYIADEANKGKAVVLNHKPIDYHKRIAAFWILDRKRTAYIAADDFDEWYVVEDGKRHEKFDRVYMVRLSAKSLLYCGQKGKQWTVVHDGKKVLTCDAVRDMVLDSTGKRCGYTVKRNGKWELYLDNVLKRKFDDVPEKGGLRFTPGGKHVISVGKEKDGWHFYFDDKAGPAFEKIFADGITISPNGERYSYAGKKDHTLSLIIDGKIAEGADYMGALFSPNSKNCAYTSGDSVVINGKPGPEFGDVYRDSFVFSADSRQIAYRAVNKERDNIIVVNHKPSRALGEILLGPVFCADGTADALFSENEELFRLRAITSSKKR